MGIVALDTTGARFVAALRRFDPRLKMPLGLLAGVVVWRSAPLGVGLLLTVLIATLLLPGLRGRALESGRPLLAFLAIWCGLKLGIDLFSGAAVLDAFTQAGELGLRLAALMTVGLLLAVSSSARLLGQGLAWYLRPVLRGKAWQAGLALALMVHYLPHIAATYARVRQTVERRIPDAPWRQRLEVLAFACVRILSQSTWKHSTAIAVRGLDNPAAWMRPMPWRASHIATFAGLTAMAVGLTCL